MDENFKYFEYNEKHDNDPLSAGLYIIRGTKITCIIDDSCYVKDEKERNIIANCIYMFLKEKPYVEDYNYWIFTYDKTKKLPFINKRVVNIYYSVCKYPTTLSGKIDLMLLNISNCLESISSYLDGDFLSYDFRSLLPERDDYTSYSANLDYLVELGYFNKKTFTLTAKGWERVERAQNNFSNNSIFIASKFKGFENEISTIKEAIVECGFVPVCMDDYQTNNYIMPEIFKLITNANAIIGEISSGNNGVYFEIGFAKGLNKDIILVCKEEEDQNGNKILKNHFDIAQISTIYYKNIDDLRKRLIFRINNTIKKN